MSAVSQQEKIRELERKAEELQGQQKLGESLGVLEEVFIKKREVYGENSEEYQKTSEKLCEICNIIAMIFLNKDKFDSSYEFLKKAELLSSGSDLFRALTYNNFAQYCKKTNKVKTGIQYLQRAQEIQLKQKNPVQLADTHLNLCALLSQTEKHQEALEHILLAIVLLQDEFIQVQVTQQENNQNKGNSDNNQDSKQTDPAEKEKNDSVNEDLFSKLAIAYHNMGVEFEFLKRFDESIQTYEKAVAFATKHLGPEHSLTKQFDQVSQQAQQTIFETRQKEASRRKPASVKSPSANAIYNIDIKKPQTSQSSKSGQLKQKKSQNMRQGKEEEELENN